MIRTASGFDRFALAGFVISGLAAMPQSGTARSEPRFLQRLKRPAEAGSQ